jgi:futalosine hydrolase
MEILLVAATTFEIQPTIDFLRDRNAGGGPVFVTPLITGVGGLATGYALTRRIGANPPGLVLQAGIAGCLTDKQPGEVLAVCEEVLADLGVWEEQRFKSLFDLKLADPEEFPFSDGRLVNPYESLLTMTDLESVRAMTVNEITTDPKKIGWHQQYTHAVVESLEGGPLHYVCLQLGVPFLQLRSISNAVGVRDKTKWNIPLAINRLNEELIPLLEKLEKELPIAGSKSTNA